MADVAAVPQQQPNLDDALADAMRRGYVAAFRLLGSPEEAKDATQEAAARALGARDRYDPAQPFYPWFYRILKNHCLDRLRSRGRSTGLANEPADDRETVEAPLLEDERARTLARALGSLDEELRTIIELRHFQDASYQEIAEILDIPKGTVMSRLYRARKSLRDAVMRERRRAESQRGEGQR